ncbi:MAG: DUF1592 domain-containing protein [Pirellulaceae bacterium]
MKNSLASRRCNYVRQNSVATFARTWVSKRHLGFNDIFLTLGYDGVPERVLSYDHFSATRHWTQKHDLSDVPEDERQKARYALANDYREAILREPLELIEYIVRNDRPFTELVTADYIMVSPYTARGYGIYEELQDHFTDLEDPLEYIPTRLRASTSPTRNSSRTSSAMFMARQTFR